MKLDHNAKYLATHQWGRPEGDLVVCGVTDYAQDQLQEVVWVEGPQIGDTFAQKDVFGEIESAKVVNDLFMPLSGEIVEVNEGLEEEPNLVNDDPYGEGWIIKFLPSDLSDWDNLLTAEEYQKAVEEEES